MPKVPKGSLDYRVKEDVMRNFNLDFNDKVTYIIKESYTCVREAPPSHFALFVHALCDLEVVRVIFRNDISRVIEEKNIDLCLRSHMIN